jgi:hypothetical protein
VDAPEVARTAERAVTLTITTAEVAALPVEPSKLVAVPSKLSRMFGFRKRG